MPLPPPSMPLPPPYDLHGPQVEPKAACWGGSPTPLHVVATAEIMAALTPPPYPTDPMAIKAELTELHELAQMRDDPTALHSSTPGRERRPLSFFLQLRPPPLGAVYNTLRPPTGPIIATGRELARMFEAETPGLAHRQAMNFLIKDSGWSPPRQARAWAALDIAIYSALLAAWHYKWSYKHPNITLAISYRQRPWEADNTLPVLFDHAVNADGSGDGPLRIAPEPSPGTPRHPAYPSGHSTYSAAGSEVLKALFPGYDTPLDDLADNIGMARLWAGIHWRSDHTFGRMLGKAVGQLVLAQLGADGAGSPPVPPPPAGPARPAAPPRRRRGPSAEAAAARGPALCSAGPYDRFCCRRSR